MRREYIPLATLEFAGALNLVHGVWRPFLLDIALTHSFAFRPVQADYVLTRFGSGFTSGNQNQSNFRYQAGIQFRF